MGRALTSVIAFLRGIALLAYSVQRFAGLKPLTPLRPGLCGEVKPLLPLLARNA